MTDFGDRMFSRTAKALSKGLASRTQEEIKRSELIN
jgi:hypothetical protein